VDPKKPLIIETLKDILLQCWKLQIYQGKFTFATKSEYLATINGILISYWDFTTNEFLGDKKLLDNIVYSVSKEIQLAISSLQINLEKLPSESTRSKKK
jgi:hypothetical protein